MYFYPVSHKFTNTSRAYLPIVSLKIPFKPSFGQYNTRITNLSQTLTSIIRNKPNLLTPWERPSLPTAKRSDTRLVTQPHKIKCPRQKEKTVVPILKNPNRTHLIFDGTQFSLSSLHCPAQTTYILKNFIHSSDYKQEKTVSKRFSAYIYRHTIERAHIRRILTQ